MKQYKVHGYIYKVGSDGSGLLRYGSTIDEWVTIPVETLLELAEMIKEDMIKNERV